MADRKKEQASIPLVMPEDLRRKDPGADRPDSLPETGVDLDHVGVGQSQDGDNPNHPIHDEDMEDLGPEDFEQMADELEKTGLKIRED